MATLRLQPTLGTLQQEYVLVQAWKKAHDYQIGHSYFCPRNSIRPDDGWYRRVIESEIVPLIQEYWFDNEEQVKKQRGLLLA